MTAHRVLTSVAALSVLVVAVSAAVSADKHTEEFRPLFNGKDLTGWVPVNTAPSTWSVQDGMLVCTGKPTGELRTDRMYQNFILEVEWRHMVPRGNAGIFVWADDITAKGQPFHRGIAACRSTAASRCRFWRTRTATLAATRRTETSSRFTAQK